jgi:predicted nucleic acid-binding protein
VPHVRPVVLDTSVILPATLSPRGYRRRFWVLLAFGALAARRNLARLEADALRREGGVAGSESGGLPVDALAAQADARYRRLSELLPPGCPDDWRLVGSKPLLEEYVRKLRETGPKLDQALRPNGIEVVRRQIESVCADMTEDFDPTKIPRYTADRDDDPVVHTALLADATWLIADDRRHISTDPHGITEYELPGSERRVSAVTFSRFLEHLTDIDLDHVDPGLLAVAFGPLT